MAQELPTVNLTDGIDTIAKTLDTAFRTVGFIAINYDDHMLDVTSRRLLEQFDTFCDLPLETKMKYKSVDPQGQRGYTPNGTEQSGNSEDGKTNVNEWREHLFYGPQYSSNHPLGQWKPYLYPDNVVITEPGCELLEVRAMYVLEKLDAMNLKMLEAIAQVHGKPIGTYASLFAYGHNGVRIHRYPAFTEADGDILGPHITENGVQTLHVRIPNEQGIMESQYLGRADRHRDIDGCTSLMAANDSGLHIQARDGSVIAYTMREGQLIKNTGEMLEKIIPGYHAAYHWVDLTEEMAQRPRNSLVDFHHPRYTVDINGKREGVHLTDRLWDIGYGTQESRDHIVGLIESMPDDSHFVEQLLKLERENPKAPQLLTQYVGKGL